MKTERRDWRLTHEPVGATYHELLACASVATTSLGLITYASRQLSQDGLLVDLSQYKKSSKTVTAWPGSTLADGYVAELETFDYDSAVAAVLLRYTRRLYDWGYPYLPDDPHWLRKDGSLWLGTIVHEEVAWLELSSAERAAIEQSSPSVSELLIPA